MNQILTGKFIANERKKKGYTQAELADRLGIREKRKTAVAGISFTAKSGEIFELLGPNGAGKTTTMRMLATLLNPDSGDTFYQQSL